MQIAADTCGTAAAERNDRPATGASPGLGASPARQSRRPADGTVRAAAGTNQNITAKPVRALAAEPAPGRKQIFGYQ